jgi:hypothetical protein
MNVHLHGLSTRKNINSCNLRTWIARRNAGLREKTFNYVPPVSPYPQERVGALMPYRLGANKQRRRAIREQTGHRNMYDFSVIYK